MPKTILISGGSDGLGKALAKELVLAKHKVIILSRHLDTLSQTAKEVGADFAVADVSSYETLSKTVLDLLQKHSSIDVVVNNAGIWMEGELDQSDPQKIEELIKTNVLGTIFLTKLLLPHFKSKKTGHIINIISQDGKISKKSHSIYCSSKWAITGFTKCLQDDCRDTPVKVTGVYPGLINTSLFVKNNTERDLSQSMSPHSVAKQIRHIIESDETNIEELTLNYYPSTTMDNSQTPNIDLNIDPSMITPQNTPPSPVPNSTQTTPSQSIPDVPQAPVPEALSPLPTLTPPSPVPNSTQTTPSQSIPNVPLTPSQSITPPALPSSPSPLYEDPDSVVLK